jgi:hypothetical protein
MLGGIHFEYRPCCRFAQERVRNEIRQLATTYFTKIQASTIQDKLANAGTDHGTAVWDWPWAGLVEWTDGSLAPFYAGERRAEEANAPLMEFLRTVYSDFTAIIENHQSLIRLLNEARGRQESQQVSPLVRRPIEPSQVTQSPSEAKRCWGMQELEHRHRLGVGRCRTCGRRCRTTSRR